MQPYQLKKDKKHKEQTQKRYKKAIKQKLKNFLCTSFTKES